jgi:hypothetical protein
VHHNSRERTSIFGHPFSGGLGKPIRVNVFSSPFPLSRRSAAKADLLPPCLSSVALAKEDKNSPSESVFHLCKSVAKNVPFSTSFSKKVRHKCRTVRCFLLKDYRKLFIRFKMEIKTNSRGPHASRVSGSASRRTPRKNHLKTLNSHHQQLSTFL